jgi:Right handed beta helix region
MAVFTVTNLNDSGAGSLRAAIQSANSTGAGVSNAIAFAVTGTITLNSDLPSITGTTAIVAGNTATGNAPTVGINFNGHAGLVFATGSDGSQLVGLALGNANGNGVTLNAGGIVLNNDYVGLALNGSALGNTGDGVFVAATSANNQIGFNPQAAILAGQGAAATGVVSNVISANGGNGISLHGSANNTVVSNRIGTSVDGNSAMANGGNGIWLTAGSSGNTIGGAVAGNNTAGAQNNPTGNKGDASAIVVVPPPLGNLVSGNGADGIRIDTSSTNNTLSGNFVGTTRSGTGDLGNQGDGVAIIGADGNSLLGCTVIDNPFIYYNVVSGNGGNGILVTNSNNVTIRANFVGLGADNATVVGNARDGILINGSSQNTQVGGVIPLGNVVSGNSLNGIEVADTASGFSTLNTFGGITAFYGIAPNGNDGVLITSTGGNQTVQTNVLSGNLNNGLEIGGNASGVSVVPNIIGLNTRGDGILANSGDGVLITGTAHDNVVGGTGLVPNLSVIRQNTISGNTGYGVEISGAAYNNVVGQSAIGTNIQESAALANGAGGVLLGGTGTGNLVGTALVGPSPLPSPAAQVNIISGNTGNGVTIAAGVSGDAVVNNWIGLNILGQPTLPNSGVGIQGNGGANLIYGNAPSGSILAQSPTGNLEGLYVGWFGRAADPATFQSQMTSYLTLIQGGASVSAAALSLSQGFASSAEIGPYAALGSIVTPVANPTPSQTALAASFIDQTFTNLFGHAADVGSQAFWQNSFFSGAVPFPALVYDIAISAQGADLTALVSKIAAASYFTTATGSLVLPPSPAAMHAAVSGVVDATTSFASDAATDVLAGKTHSQVTYSSILGPGNVTTGVRADLDGAVILTGSQVIAGTSNTQATLFQGPLNNAAAGTLYVLNPTFAGGAVKTASFYGPDTTIFDPGLGAGNVRAVGSFQFQNDTPGVLNHGMIYQGAVSGAGGTWTQIDVPSNGVNVVGGTTLGAGVADTILHSTQGDLVVGNYDLVGQPASGNGFIYNMATHQFTLMKVDNSLANLTSLYGIWQNGIGSTSYTIAGGTRDNHTGLNVGLLENYDSSTGVLSNLTYFTGNNTPGVITHFENITAVPGGFNLVATTDSGPSFAFIARNPDGSFGSAVWALANLPGSSLQTGNIVFQNTIGGIYNTTNSSTFATYTGVVDQSHVSAAGGLIMPVGSYNFAYALTVAGSIGDSIVGSATAGNVLGGSIGNDSFTGTLNGTQADTIFTGGGSDAITLAAGHTAHDRIELFAANAANTAAALTPGGAVTSVASSIVNAADIPQLGWWGEATGQAGGPVSNASTNAGSGTGTSKDMSTVVNFVTDSAGAAVDTVDISLSAFSSLLRNDGGGSALAGKAVFSNLVDPGGTVTVANANVLLIHSPAGFANAAAVAAALLAHPITFAGSQTAALNHYIIAYQDIGGSVRLADMDIQRGSAASFATTAGGQTLSVSDMVQLGGVTLANLQPGNITFVDPPGGSGDVHMITFAGLHYDFQATGDFEAVRSTDASNPWQFQIRTAALTDAVSITTELAAAFGDDRVTFAVGRPDTVRVDGTADTLNIGDVQSLYGGTLSHPTATSWQLTWTAGESVTIKDMGPNLDWTVALGPHDGPGSVQGLLGANISQTTDFQLPDSTLLQHPSDADILGTFADAWRVTPDTSLFDDTFKPKTATSPAELQLIQAASGGMPGGAPISTPAASSPSGADPLAAFTANPLLHA